MELIRIIEQQLINLSEGERLEHIKEISYFIQCVAQYKKTMSDSDNPLEVIVIESTTSPQDSK